MQFIQRRWNFQPQFIQPCLVDHGKLGNGVNAVIFVRTDSGSPHFLSGRQTIDISVVHGNGAQDIRILLQDLCQVRHIFFCQIRGQVDKCTVIPIARQVIVAESYAHERVRKFISCDTDIHLLCQRLAHHCPVNVDPCILLKLVQYHIIIVALAQGAHAAQYGKIRLGCICICLASYFIAWFLTTCRQGQYQSCCKGTGCKPSPLSHFYNPAPFSKAGGSPSPSLPVLIQTIILLPRRP